MIKVITYGTYDLFHFGHVRLLKRAKALGDYLIVGVTADDFDKNRGKINVQQSLMERIEAVKASGIADEIIVEEYEGQKIDDIKRYNVDIFTVGSDWAGKFDYLNEYCKVVYLPRTEGVSSTELRSDSAKLKVGLIGHLNYLKKISNECSYVNGLEVSAICSHDIEQVPEELSKIPCITSSFDEFLEQVDAIYILSAPHNHYEQIKKALFAGKHILCEPPIALSAEQAKELHQLALKNECVLMEAMKTAYATAYARLMLLVKSGRIGKVVSVDATCTSMNTIEKEHQFDLNRSWNSICAWGPVGMLPVFQLLGTDFKQKTIISKFADPDKLFDSFTKISFIYNDAVASVKVGKGVKSEGELVISGTEGYVYVPAPWWKTDYFEIRYENQNNNKRYFYQLDGEGIRYEFVAFLKSITKKANYSYIDPIISYKISSVINDFYEKKDCLEID